MTHIRRSLGVLPVLLIVLALTSALAACGGGGGPAAKIGDLSVDKYVALGDGYASSPYSAETDRAQGCLRSAASYPALLAAKLKAKEYVDASCAFARTQALLSATEPARGRRGPVPAQLDSVDATTDVVTLTIGLSDRDLDTRLLQVCRESCAEGGVPLGELVDDVAQLSDSLTDVLKQVGEQAPDARVIVVGYPTLLPREGICEAVPELDQDRADMVNALLGRVGTTLARAARAEGADYLDVASLSSGHDVCSEEPWVNGGAGAPGPAGEVPRFHPLPPLNEAIAAALEADLTP